MYLIDVLAENSWLFYTFVFLLGLVVGSFLNVVILRYPKILKYEWESDCSECLNKKFIKEKPPGIAFSRSFCPKCKSQLKAWHNLPVFSYVFLKAQCGFCKEKIPFRYPFVELLTALMSLLLAFHYGMSVQLLSGLMLLWVLMVITWIDIDTFLIPDQLSLSLLWLGLFVSLFEVFIVPEQAIIGALVGYLILWSVFWAFKLVTGKDGMGYGDFKLLAAGGAWLGAEDLIVVLIVSSVSGLIASLLGKFFGKGESKIPFGPYLSLGILITLMFGDQILAWYMP